MSSAFIVSLTIFAFGQFDCVQHRESTLSLVHIKLYLFSGSASTLSLFLTYVYHTRNTHRAGTRLSVRVFSAYCNMFLVPPNIFPAKMITYMTRLLTVLRWPRASSINSLIPQIIIITGRISEHEIFSMRMVRFTLTRRVTKTNYSPELCCFNLIFPLHWTRHLGFSEAYSSVPSEKTFSFETPTPLPERLPTSRRTLQRAKVISPPGHSMKSH